MAKGSASAAVLERKERNRIEQTERETYNKYLRSKRIPTPWERAMAARRKRRAGLVPQPRNNDGFIVKRGKDGSEYLVECCAKCTKDARLALMDQADVKMARKAEEATRRKARATSKRADAKPAGRGADSRRKAPTAKAGAR